MMRINIKLACIWIGISLLAAACSSNDGEASPTPQPESVLTAAAQTAEAQLTELAEPGSTATPSPLPEETINPAPTDSAGLGTDLAPTQDPNATPFITVTPITGGVDQAEFWADVTIPDGTDFDSGAAFTKVWQLRNSGTNTWTQDYGLAFFGGEQMSAPAVVNLTQNVPPGGTVDVSVDMTAPQSAGTYTGFWKMRNAIGEFFDYAVFVQINVISGQAVGTAVPGPSGDGEVTAVSISVDDAAPDDCPHTFTFTASFTLDEPAMVTYLMEAGSDTPGFTFNIPGELTGSFDAGTHAVVFTLDIQDSVDGWAQLRITSPNNKVSNQATFTLSCTP
jgi:hypothetical protein